MREKTKNQQTPRKMRLLALFMLLGLCSVHAVTRGQEARIDLSMSDVSLSDVFQRIEQLTDYMFVYKMEDVLAAGKVNVNVRQCMVKDILAVCLRNTKLTYVFKDNVIIIRQKNQNNEDEKLSFTVKGWIKDKKQQALPGVSVKLAGTTVGTVSNVHGWFSMELPVLQGKLELSFVGYKKQTIAFTEKTDTLNIVMEEEVQEIDEVVITGYQTIKKQMMAGSASTVKGEDLLFNGVQTLEQALQGQIPGMIVMNRSGLTGTRQRIRVRGTSTLLGNAEPVWVVDGIIQEDPLPFETNELNNLNPDNMDMIRNFVGGAISWLNPNDIESITVLKDASATAIYGVRAANGVIVITTKKGESGRMNLNYTLNFSVTPRLTYKDMELMNSQERVDVSREAFQKRYILKNDQEIGYLGLALAFKRNEISLQEFSEKVAELENTNTDWFDILFRTAISQAHTLSISGGKDYTSYRASFGFTDTKNPAKGNGQKRYTTNMSLSMNFWEKLTFNASISGTISETEAFAGDDPYTYASSTNRIIGCYDENDDLLFYKSGSNGYLFNIVNELQESGNRNTQSSLNTNLTLRWDISEAYQFNSTFGFSYSNTDGESWRTEQSNYIAEKRGYNYGEYVKGDKEFDDSFLPVGGEYNKSQNTSMGITWRNQLDFRTIFNDVHSVTATAGVELRSTQNTGYKKTTYGYLPDRGKIFVDLPPNKSSNPNAQNNLLTEIPTITDTENNYLSLFLTLDYMYDNRYALNASVRTDASNRFGQDKRSRFLPVWALGLRWNLGNEPWLQGGNVLSDMNIRFSYGYQGNVAENVSPNLIANIETKNRDYVLVVNKLPAPELKWEKVHDLNVGVDVSLFRSRISATFEWYMKKTMDMIIEQKIPYENGISTRPINGGRMTNKGWDCSLNFVPFRTQDWNVSCNFTFSKVYNAIKSEITPTGSWEEASSGNLNKEGYPVSAFWAFRFMGLNPENGGPQFDLTGAELKESDRDATLYMDYMGKMEPDFTTNLMLSVNYKTWTLSSTFYLSLGNKQFLAPMSGNYTSIPEEYENMSTEWLNRWRKPGDELHTSIPSLPDIRTSAKTIKIETLSDDVYTKKEFKPYELYAYSDARVVDAWFLKCSNIMLSYNVAPDHLPDFLQGISFNFSVTNPFQIQSKDFLGRDPEVALGSQPLSSTFSLGINVNF